MREKLSLKKIVIGIVVFVLAVIAVSGFALYQNNKKTDLGDEYLLEPRQDVQPATPVVYNLEALKRRLSLTTGESNRIRFAFEDFIRTQQADARHISVNLDSIGKDREFTTFTVTTSTDKTFYVEEMNGYTTIKDVASGPAIYVSARD